MSLGKRRFSVECYAYLDIETTGLNPLSSELTVVGIYRENGGSGFIQLVGDEINPSRIIGAMENVSVLYTYNGSRFDLPFIRTKLGLDLTDYCRHRDLMYSCWKRNLYGGLKGVERQLGIERTLPDVDGWIAVQLWQKYESDGDRNALETLLKYNEEDVKNLSLLRQRLTL
jgi:uncharacterized protein YprB with RNaseH-like and TPR domain